MSICSFFVRPHLSKRRNVWKERSPPRPPLVDPTVTMRYEQQRMEVLNTAMQGIGNIVSCIVVVLFTPPIHCNAGHGQHCELHCCGSVYSAHTLHIVSCIVVVLFTPPIHCNAGHGQHCELHCCGSVYSAHTLHIVSCIVVVLFTPPIHCTL